MDWTALLSTFGLLFLAELGDKTQLAVITQTSRCRRPWPVFLGATLALTGVTGLGVVAGQLAGWLIPGEWIRWIAAAGFVAVGLWLAWDSRRAGRSVTGDACEPEDEPGARGSSDWRIFGATFLLLFLAEMGDKTQLAVIAQASQSGTPWAVLVGAILALTTVTALGVLGGQGLARVIPERWLRWLAAVAFIVLGILIGLGVF